MRAGGQTGGADVTYHLLLLHLRTDLYAFGKTRQVHVGGDVSPVVADFDVVAASVALVSLGYHFPVAHGVDGSACRSGIIDTVVGTVTLQHRMEAGVGETRRDAVEIQGCLQEGALQAVALFVVIQFFTFLHEGDGVVRAVRMAESGGQDVKVVQRLVVDVFLLVDDAELVVLLQIEKVDRPSVDAGQYHRQQRRRLAVLHGHPERRLHAAFHRLLPPHRGILAPAHGVIAPQVENDV